MNNLKAIIKNFDFLIKKKILDLMILIEIAVNSIAF